MGASGVDIQLSEAALRVCPYAIEAKSRASIAVYQYFEQATENAGDRVPLLCIKQNHSQPLVVITLDHFMELLSASQKNN